MTILNQLLVTYRLRHYSLYYGAVECLNLIPRGAIIFRETHG